VRRSGYATILVAAAVYAVAALVLDYYGPQGISSGSLTYFDLLRGPDVSGAGAMVTSGAVLTVFGGAVALAIVAILGLRGPASRALRGAAIGGVAVWDAFVVGGTFTVLSRREDLPLDLGPGFWAQPICAAIATIGALVLLRRSSAPGGVHEEGRAGDAATTNR
jgi:hypothetical protein